MKNIGVVYHPKNQAAPAMVNQVLSMLGQMGAATWQSSAWDSETISQKAVTSDFIITVGGDGTILRTANAILPGKTPITGINLGRLGFLTEINADETKDKLQLLLKGEVWVDERSVLEARLQLPGKDRQFPDQSFWALNDVVVARGEVARIIHIDAAIDGQPLTNYRADGVILATATGSTGYALAAGGPVLHPQAEEFVLVPIVPHLSAGFNLVLPKTAVVKLLIRNTYPSVLNIDGHTSINLPDEARVTVTNCAYKVYFLRLKPKVSFYSTLEKRLRI